MVQWLSFLDFTDPGFNGTDEFSEATEMEYLRKVLFEYMMGRETKVGPLLSLLNSVSILV